MHRRQVNAITPPVAGHAGWPQSMWLAAGAAAAADAPAARSRASDDLRGPAAGHGLRDPAGLAGLRLARHRGRPGPLRRPRTGPLRLLAQRRRWLPGNFIAQIVEDAHHDLWIAIKDCGTRPLEPGDGQLHRLSPRPRQSRLARERCHAHRARGCAGPRLGRNTMPASTCSIPHRATFEHLRHDPREPELAGRRPDLHADARPLRSALGGHRRGLDRWQPERRAFAHFRHDRRDPALPRAATRSRRCIEDRSGSFWVGTFDGGLDRMDRDGHVVESFRHDPKRRGLARERRGARPSRGPRGPPVGRNAGRPRSARSRHRTIFVTIVTTTATPARCAIRSSCRCTRIAPAWSGSARATAASAAGIRAAGSSAAIARIGSAASWSLSFADAPERQGLDRIAWAAAWSSSTTPRGEATDIDAIVGRRNASAISA